MQFKDIFERPIERHMDSVIKSDDSEHLMEELEEYVLTPEVRRSLQKFCDEYNDSGSSGNGAWISGFYGSGKSHLLKMLSYMVENAEVGGKPALDYMKPKLKDDGFLLSALARACEGIPSESILFNVGAKSDSDRRDSGEALLNAFIKVLNERCGYFAGEQAYVASLERDLDREGLYGAFKDAVRAELNREWDQVRSNPRMFAAKVSRVYDSVTDQPEGTNANIFAAYQESYHPTPEDFANWVWEYIEKRDADEPGFRLNFFADEMGQYIADSVPLLQMLQDIAENLNTKCRRRAWVVVVSQEDMSAITGRLDASASGQFSKIQARFKILIKIPANDANTVVKERLLEKKRESLAALDKVYAKYEGDFKVLLDFPDGSKHYKVYEDLEDFEATYPLVPYQFTMFHDALVGLSRNDAFTGEYVSTGARNMLGTTHRVLVAYKDKGSVESGDLVPFDAMFEGLRDELKSEVFSAISTAEDHFGDELGVRLLKALLLVKYNEGYQATPKNLRVLLYRGFSEDAMALEERIEDVLRELDAQTYIRRNGEAYEYLTDDEKDVEEEIKREAVTDGEVSKKIGELIRNDVLTRSKVRFVHKGFSTTFGYSLQVDGVAIGQQNNDLAVNVVTDLSAFDPDSYKFADQKQLVIMLPMGTRLTNEVRLHMQTAKYVGRELSEGGGRRATILAEKQSANDTRREEIITMIKGMLDEAKFGTCYSDVTAEVTGQGGDRFDRAVEIMVEHSYPHLKMLASAFDKNTIYAEATAGKAMDGTPLPPYAEEALLEIRKIDANAARCLVGGPTGNSLEARLGGGQHGWPVEAVRQAVAVLAANDRVECFRNDEPLEKANLAAALAQGDHLSEVSVRPAQAVSAEQVGALKAAYQRITGMPPAKTDPKPLADDIIDALSGKCTDLHGALVKSQSLPFFGTFDAKLAELDSYSRKKRDWFISSIGDETDAIASLLDELTSMAEFANGQPGTIFSDASAFLKAQASNIAAVDGMKAKADDLQALLDDPECYTYSSGPQAKRLVREMRDSIDAEVEQARSEAKSDLDGFAAAFRSDSGYSKADDSVRAAADGIIEACSERIETSSQILEIEGMVASFKAKESGTLWAMVEPKTEPIHPVDPPIDLPINPVPPVTPPAVKTVSYAAISIPPAYKNKTLATPSEVDGFVAALHDELMKRVDNDERIIL